MIERLVDLDDDDGMPLRTLDGPTPVAEPDRSMFPPGVLFQLGNEQARTEPEVIGIAVRYLADRCDGAARRDDSGYNRLHARLGHSLAEIPVEAWSDRQLWAARKMLETYKNRQLGFMWNYMPPLIEEPPASAQEQRFREWKQRTDPTFTPEPFKREMSLFKRDGAFFVKLQHNYDPTLLDAIKSIPQRRYEGGTPEHPEKYWYVPLQLDSLEVLVDVATEYGYTIPENVQEAIDSVLATYQETVELSRASDTDFHVDLPDGLELFPFQKAGVQYATKVGNALIADEMGLGKTVQALATIKVTDAYPVIVICPASLKRNWERETRKWLPDARVAVLKGQPYPLRHPRTDLRRYDVVIINYNSRVLEKWLMELVGFGAGTIVLDEAHNVKNESAQQTKLVAQLLQYSSKARRLLLTGTPVVNRPVEFWTLIKMLGRAKEMGGYTEYMKRYDTTRRERLEELNMRARTHFMIRRLKMDVLPELPPKLRTIVPIEIDNAAEYDNVERDIAGYFALRKANDEEFLAELDRYADAKGLTDGARRIFIIEAKREHFSNAYMIAANNEALLRWEALKQMAVAGKMKGVFEWIDDFLTSGQKLIVFGTHTERIEQIARRYNAPMIHGGIPVEKRMPLVDRFQNDPECKVIVGNMIAMGEGLTLTAASNVAFIEFGWNPKTHDQAEDRAHRIGQHDNVMVWNLAAIRPSGEPTIDFELAEMIMKKRAVVDAIQDGADGVTQTAMLDELRARYKDKIDRAASSVIKAPIVAQTPVQRVAMIDDEDDLEPLGALL